MRSYCAKRLGTILLHDKCKFAGALSESGGNRMTENVVPDYDRLVTIRFDEIDDMLHKVCGITYTTRAVVHNDSKCWYLHFNL